MAQEGLKNFHLFEDDRKNLKHIITALGKDAQKLKEISLDLGSPSLAVQIKLISLRIKSLKEALEPITEK